MKKGTFLMLLIGCSILFAAVGFANANVNEQPCSDGVGLVDEAINASNQIVIETTFDLQRIDNYTLVSVNPTSDNMVKDLQTSNVATTSIKLRPELVRGVVRIQLKKARRLRMLLRINIPQERGASMQRVFYNQFLFS